MKREKSQEIKKETEKNDAMEKIVSLAKRRGFIFQGSEIYGGLAGTYDFGPLGVALKNNIKSLWWKRFVEDREDMYGVDAAILMNRDVWKASGHVAGFADPLVECPKCHHRFREDQIEKNAKDGLKHCPDCDTVLGAPKQFNMMFQTHVGTGGGEESVSYLRPETAQGMFVNYKNVLDSLHPKLPFGLAQIGKAFRNEIAPRDFIFRLRELEQMEIEYFVNPNIAGEWEKTFEQFRLDMHDFIEKDLGLSKKKVHELEVADGDRAHYSKRTIDFEFDFPFGRKELYGLAYRTDFDLRQHSTASGVDLSYFDEDTKSRFIPHCIEPSFGVERTVLAVLADAYMEDDSVSSEDETVAENRVYLKFSPKVAPIKVAVFPLLKNKPVLVEKAREVYVMIKRELAAIAIHGVEFDDNGNIGKRYRRQDEIGTPLCITVDFETIEENAGVTVRNRNNGTQKRIVMTELISYLKNELQN